MSRDFVEKILKSDRYRKFQEDVVTGNVTANIDGYQTPNAFSDDEDSEGRTELIGKFGITAVKKTKRNFVNDSEFKKTASALYDINEISYKDYKRDSTVPQSKKINDSILQIERLLREVETRVRHVHRLKTETSHGYGDLFEKTKRRLVSIKERLVKIVNRVNELGS
jgi:hypothetical protein